MTDRRTMNERDEWLLRLYDGDGAHRDGPTADGPAEADDEAALREIIGLLDERPRKKPEAGTVSAILAAAKGEAVPRGVRRDRPPARRPRVVALRVGGISAIVVVLIAIVGILQSDALRPSSDGHVADVPGPAAADRAVPSGIDIDPGASGDVAGIQHSEDAAADTAVSLAWDDQTDVIELQQRIEMIGSGVDGGWGQPAVPLEMLPSARSGSGSGGGIIPAGASR